MRNLSKDVKSIKKVLDSISNQLETESIGSPGMLSPKSISP